MESTPQKHTSSYYGALVWIVSGITLSTYGLLGLLHVGIPGVEELVGFLENADGIYIYIAAFLAIFLEGLYFFGNFFPGSTIILILTILSQAGGPGVFIGTIATIFFGWCTAGAVNIFMAHTYQKKVLGSLIEPKTVVSDNLFTTWFPAFRANYEVAQIAEGGNPWRVFLSSVRVKFIVSLGMLVVTFFIPYVIDIKEVDNEEGFLSVAVIATIFFVVGIYKLRKAHYR
jgi:hypothetical protein